MAYTNGDQVWAKIEDDFGKLLKTAAKEAATKAQKEIRKKADMFIKDYYKYEPVLYRDRKYLLYKLVENYYREDESADGIEIEFGIVYNPSKISKEHKSNSRYHKTGTKWIPRSSKSFKFDSQDNGIPDAEWITNQFLEGYHPSGRIGEDIGNEDPYGSPDKRMQEFFDSELGNMIDQYISSSLLNSLKKYF